MFGFEPFTLGPQLTATCTTSADHVAKADGIFVYTYQALEPKAVKIMVSGACVPHQPTPPVDCICPFWWLDEWSMLVTLLDNCIACPGWRSSQVRA